MEKEQRHKVQVRAYYLCENGLENREHCSLLKRKAFH